MPSLTSRGFRRRPSHTINLFEELERHTGNIRLTCQPLVMTRSINIGALPRRCRPFSLTERTACFILEAPSLGNCRNWCLTSGAIKVGVKSSSPPLGETFCRGLAKGAVNSPSHPGPEHGRVALRPVVELSRQRYAGRRGGKQQP